MPFGSWFLFRNHKRLSLLRIPPIGKEAEGPGKYQPWNPSGTGRFLFSGNIKTVKYPDIHLTGRYAASVWRLPAQGHPAARKAWLCSQTRNICSLPQRKSLIKKDGLQTLSYVCGTRQNRQRITQKSGYTSSGTGMQPPCSWNGWMKRQTLTQCFPIWAPTWGMQTSQTLRIIMESDKLWKVTWWQCLITLASPPVTLYITISRIRKPVHKILVCVPVFIIGLNR